MKRIITSILVFVNAVLILSAQTVIKVNQLGYLTGYPKYAWVNDISKKEVKWYVKRVSDNHIVYASTAKPSEITDPATGEKVTCLDFTVLNTPGNYYIEVETGGISFTFPVSDHVYNKVWSACVKSYYFQRSGMDLTSEYAGIWARKASHTRDAMLYGGFENGKIIAGEQRQCRGGWYDAGDFGKKIVPASIAFFSFMKFAELYPEKVKAARVDIPNPWKGLPDMLAEVKWELDWFFTMQENNGAVHHLIVSPDFFIGPAQNDPLPRYITGISSTSTADYAAAMAMASAAYRDYLPSYADSCLTAAEKAWEYLQNNTDVFPAGGYRDPEGIHGTGAYGDPFDADERLWASAELYNITGKAIYRDYFESNYRYFPIKSFGWWFDPHNYALLTWLLNSNSDRNQTIVMELRQQVRRYADSISRVTEMNGYGAALSPDQYIWGSNSYILNYGMELLIINTIFQTKAYTEAALHQLNYILGCNSLNLSFVSGYGSNAVKDPHQSINSYDTLSLAPPGFVPGGPNKNKEDFLLTGLIKSKNPPPAKCYLDLHASYASNEVCLCYTSGLILLAGFFYNSQHEKGDK